MRKRYLYLLLILSLFFPPGCTELKTTARIMNVALIELFRLPIYILKIPFQILQNLGPMLQAGLKTAANMAPLLLFIENQAPKDTLYAGVTMPDMTAGDVQSLLPVLDREIADGAPVRFALVDARLLEHKQLRKALLGSLGGEGKRIRCVTVDASDIFTDQERFFQICSRMRTRGDSLFALTAFNDDLQELTDAVSGDLPPSPADSRFLMRWGSLMKKIETDSETTEDTEKAQRTLRDITEPQNVCNHG